MTTIWTYRCESVRRMLTAASLVFALVLSHATAAAEAQHGDGRTPTGNQAAQASPTSTPAADPDQPETLDSTAFQPDGRYRLTQSDVLELRFPYVPEFDQTITIQPDGYVSLQGIGDIRIAGRSLPELKALLADAYGSILRQPVIDIVLKEFETPYFMVAGEVARPGKFELRGATTLTQAIVLAGGPTGAAKSSQVVLFRQLVGEWLEVKQVDVKKMYASRDMSEDPLLQPGDTIFVPKTVMSSIAPFIPRPGLGLYLNPLGR